MTSVTSLPPAIHRMVFLYLNVLYSDPEHLLSDIVERPNVHHVRWIVYCNRRDFDFSVFEAMLVCQAWRESILDIVIRKNTTIEDERRAKRRNLAAACAMLSWLDIVNEVKA